MCWLICCLVSAEFGTEAQSEQILVPQQARWTHSRPTTSKISWKKSVANRNSRISRDAIFWHYCFCTENQERRRDGDKIFSITAGLRGRGYKEKRLLYRNSPIVPDFQTNNPWGLSTRTNHPRGLSTLTIHIFRPIILLWIAGISRLSLGRIHFHGLRSVRVGIHRNNPCIRELYNLQGNTNGSVRKIN